MEMVLAINTSRIKGYLAGHSYSLLTDSKDDILQIIYNNYKFLPRNQIELDPEYRQIIPYCVLSFGGKYILFQRLNKQTETRLHSKLSLGAGGHINSKDISTSPSEIVKNCIQRELREEIRVNYSFDEDAVFAGVINDESCEVSRSHLGLLFVINLKSNYFQVMEKEKMTAQWFPTDELLKQRELFEDWSKITLDQYIKRERKSEICKG